MDHRRNPRATPLVQAPESASTVQRVSNPTRRHRRWREMTFIFEIEIDGTRH